jgi:hypothetical protein
VNVAEPASVPAVDAPAAAVIADAADDDPARVDAAAAPAACVIAAAADEAPASEDAVLVPAAAVMADPVAATPVSVPAVDAPAAAVIVAAEDALPASEPAVLTPAAAVTALAADEAPASALAVAAPLAAVMDDPSLVVLHAADTETLLLVVPSDQTAAVLYETPAVSPVAALAKVNGSSVLVGAVSLPLAVAAPPPSSWPAFISVASGSAQPLLGPMT